MSEINLQIDVSKEEFRDKLGIKDPEPFLLEGEKIVEKVNELPTNDDDLKIDAKHIKNLPKQTINAGGGSAGLFQFKNDVAETFTAINEPTGFENRTDSSWTFTDGTRILEITGTFNYWIKGVKYSVSSSRTITIADTEGEHLVYFDTDVQLHEYVNPTTAQILVAIRDKALVAHIYWDAVNNEGVFVGEERHGCVMDGMTHYYLHYTRGLQLVSGLGLGDFVIGDGSLNTHAQFSVALGSIADEDIGLSISAIASTTGCPILYRSGATGLWRKLTQTGYSCYQNPSGTTNRLMYNQNTGVTWQTTEVGEGNYVLYHLFATTGKTNQIYSIMGQSTYTTQPAARAGATTEINNLLLGNLPGPEIRPIATVIFQTDKDYANDINARVVEAVSGGDDYVDWRTNDLPRGTVPTDTSNLVPYTGATTDVDLGANTIIVDTAEVSGRTGYPALALMATKIHVSLTEPTDAVDGDIWFKPV